jgi:hypothetical protein
VLLIRLVRTQLQNQACLRREKRRLINSQWCTLVTVFWSETVSLGFREWGGSTVLCESVWSASLRNSPAAKWAGSCNPQVGGELIWSRVSPNRASGPGFIQTLYGQTDA